MATGRRSVRYLDGRHEVPVYRRDDLRGGHVIDGPAVIEEAASVTIVNPGWRVSVDPFGNMLLGAAGRQGG